MQETQGEYNSGNASDLSTRNPPKVQKVGKAERVCRRQEVVLKEVTLTAEGAEKTLLMNKLERRQRH